MHCTLLIPDLLPPRGADGCAPALRLLLARAARERYAPLTPEAWLCQAFEVERQQDWPVAPLTLALDGGEPGAAYWLRADPVHVKLDRNRLLLADAGLLDITREEAAAYAAALAPLLAREAAVLLAPHPQRWYLRLEAAPGIATRALSEVAGGDIDRHLPDGPQRLRWHRLINELQMLLHEHPANVAREARGLPAVNSVWLWGGGVKPAVPGRHFDAVWSDEPLAPALAAHADRAAHALPADAGDWLRRAGRGRHLVVLDALSRPARYGGPGDWSERLAHLERGWFAPLLAQLRRRRLAGLALVSPGARACLRFELRAAALLRFWRRPRALAGYAA